MTTKRTAPGLKHIHTSELFSHGEDLPLFSNTPQRVSDSPFTPEDASTQPELFARPRVEMRHRTRRDLDTWANTPEGIAWQMTESDGLTIALAIAAGEIAPEDL